VAYLFLVRSVRARLFCTALIVIAYAVSTATAVTLTEEQARRLSVSTPKPEYPSAARLRHIEGHGLFLLRVRVQTGLVKSVMVERSTGSPLLDAAAVAGLTQWRFKPGLLPSIRVEQPGRKDALPKEDWLVRVPVNFMMRR